MSDNHYNIQSTPLPPSGSSSGSSSSSDGAKWNVPSIVGFVMSFVCCWPAAIVLGIVGVVQTKDGAQKGRGLAIAAIVIGALQVLFTTWSFVMAPEPVDMTITKDNAHQVADDLEREVDQDKAR